MIALAGLAQFTLHTTWVLYTTFKFGWGPAENGWSLFAVGVMLGAGAGRAAGAAAEAPLAAAAGGAGAGVRRRWPTWPAAPSPRAG